MIRMLADMNFFRYGHRNISWAGVTAVGTNSTESLHVFLRKELTMLDSRHESIFILVVHATTNADAISDKVSTSGLGVLRR